MRKYTLIILAVFLVASCSPRKKKTKSGPMNRFFTYYNTLFNSKDAFDSEMQSRDKNHKDNFFDPYISVFTSEDIAEDVQNNAFGENDGILNNGPGSPNAINSRASSVPQAKGTTTLQIAEAKALKTISKYSVLVNGVEKNKYMFDAYMLLAKSRLYQKKYLESLDALSYIMNTMPKDKRIQMARIYQAHNYAKLKDNYRSRELFLDIQDQKLKKNERALASIFYADMLLKSGKKEDAAEELADAFTFNKNSKTRSRIAFLRGQILADLGKKQEARESFATAYKYAYDFEFEVKTQIEIAKTFDGTTDDYAAAKKYLEKLSKKGTYNSRKNELYYAMGILAVNANQEKEADSLFRKSIKEKMSDPQIRGLAFSEIAKKYFAKDDYLVAGAYYDSALVSMTYAPEKERLTELTANIKKLSKNYYLIKKNDSILTLSKMSKEDQTAYFTKHIEKIKAKEAAEELAKKQAERSKGFDGGDYDANSMFANSKGGTFEDFGSPGKSTFYFNNTNNIPRGEANFKQIWGTRTLADNWRYAAKSATIEDMKNDALGITSIPDPRRLEPAFYIEQIPTNISDIAKLKKDRDTASLGLGIMFDNFFSNTKLATKTLYDLVDNLPDEDTELKALYQVFVMNYQKDPTAAERAKQMILQKYPYTSYAEFVANPRSKDFNKTTESVEKLYTEAYSLHDKGKYVESIDLIQKTITDNPKDGLIPKLYLLNAFNAGKTAGKEVMILQLEQIVLNYGNTPEGIKAKQILKFLKSDIQMELTDEQGNPTIKKEPEAAPQEKAQSKKLPARPGQPVIENSDKGSRGKIRELKAKEALVAPSEPTMSRAQSEVLQ